MTDGTLSGTAAPGLQRPSAEAAAQLRKRRHAADTRLRIAGLSAIVAAVGMLTLLLGTIINQGLPAFTQTHVRLDFPLTAEFVNPDDVEATNWRAVVTGGLNAALNDIGSVAQQRAISQIITNNAQFMVRDAVRANPSLVGGSVTLSVPAADPFDGLNKGQVRRDVAEANRRVTDAQIVWFDQLVEQGRVSAPFNWGLFFNADSRFPEMAGLAGAITGSFYLLLVCFLVSFPVGIASAIYLEEFAPKNRWTDLVEVNINNLAAVPSIVYGLLGLAVFIQVFGAPRSAPLTGGLVLSLMVLPTIIISTRAALKAIPPSIREAALGMGASKHQMVMQHVLPLAMPGILTGTIIGMAQALGETAPLLLIGMNAFVTSPPGGILDASTSLPTQIFIWADSPERGFVSRTSAAIMVLLGFLLVMNAIAIFLRNRLERRW
jgi:phosphate transport system permease protein